MSYGARYIAKPRSVNCLCSTERGYAEEWVGFRFDLPLMLEATEGADFLRDFLDPVDAHLLAWSTLRTHSLSFVSERCQTCLSLLSLLQRTADTGWLVIEKRSDLRGEIAPDAILLPEMN